MSKTQAQWRRVCSVSPKLARQVRGLKVTEPLGLQHLTSTTISRRSGTVGWEGKQTDKGR